MASRGGPRAAGTDGSDFSYRERVASHYVVSSTNKARLKIVMIAHILLGVLMTLRQTVSICAAMGINPPKFLYHLNLPQVLGWEVCWLPSIATVLFGFAALPKNQVFLMKQYILGVFVLGILPVLFGVGSIGEDIISYVKSGQSRVTFKGFPMEVIWAIFLFIAAQVHVMSVVFARKLVNAWNVIPVPELHPSDNMDNNELRLDELNIPEDLKCQLQELRDEDHDKFKKVKNHITIFLKTVSKWNRSKVQSELDNIREDDLVRKDVFKRVKRAILQQNLEANFKEPAPHIDSPPKKKSRKSTVVREPKANRRKSVIPQNVNKRKRSPTPPPEPFVPPQEPLTPKTTRSSNESNTLKRVVLGKGKKGEISQYVIYAQEFLDSSSAEDIIHCSSNASILAVTRFHKLEAAQQYVATSMLRSSYAVPTKESLMALRNLLYRRDVPHITFENSGDNSKIDIIITAPASTDYLNKKSRMAAEEQSKKDIPSPHLNDGNNLESNIIQKNLKYISLVLLTFQNTILILLMRYVRTRPGDLFISSTAVVMQELTKVLTCVIVMYFQEAKSISHLLKILHESIILQPIDTLKVCVPGIIYTIQNNLLYVAVSNLEAATYQVSYQLKILTTALFSVFMLQKKLSRMQWVSLVILFVGVSAVQLQPDSKKGSSTHEQNAIIGLSAVLISCILSGFAGVYFEKILKGSKGTIWLRNVQLGGFGILAGLATVYTKDCSTAWTNGFFFGYDYLVWIVIAIQAMGGLMVAVVVKYADNILKGFATSASIIISSIAAIFLFNFQLSVQFIFGAGLVISSVYMYSVFVYKVTPVASSKV
ncbi:DgyrCDS9972 [Dimorphilus gyrociliatus]|uniref:DgyrCDS9972 n=1 Tax=Dimorphilus gyrociliatus TaxID=2664684 RepID=A0A7I8VYR4_9ANNE|nr:DgyrCDS9972 [Dimorphilus gyrociliatus]